MKKINVITLGCSKNTVDSEHLMAQLAAAGYTVAAGWYVPDKRGSSTEGAVACETGCGAAREEGAERRPPHRSAAARAGPKGRAAATIRRE